MFPLENDYIPDEMDPLTQYLRRVVLVRMGDYRASAIAYLARTWGGASAIALDDRIYFRTDQYPVNPISQEELVVNIREQYRLALLAHEALHIFQQAETEFFRTRYVADWFLQGGRYRAIFVETEAYALEYAVRDLLHRHPTAFSEFTDEHADFMKSRYESHWGRELGRRLVPTTPRTPIIIP